MWNMPYRIEHHAVPAAPFHALPALHPGFADAPQARTPGYIAFHRAIWRGFGNVSE